MIMFYSLYEYTLTHCVNCLYYFLLDTMTWYCPKVGGTPPSPRFGHTANLVNGKYDKSRKIYIFGGHDGRRSLSDIHVFDTGTSLPPFSLLSLSSHYSVDSPFHFRL